ncbi:MAG: transcriptional regulator Spx [Lentilactobacillus diolivorans]|jgi:regulatory protein spx|nr:transcriptional regulator Spx [Lentilactobacillus diolivorans]MCH4164429.1 transcriptional regulator Spx [Lentilactobacillus diolivorans]RRG01510.1 MAG: transcriptional regulator Spx [Lactobacillus sp.]GEP23992.1 regulatory protein Spx [Lentilactobacillus diolivorans]
MTIQFLTTPSCTSCRKAKKWLVEHGIEFKERNMFANPLTRDELKQILMLSETGTDGLISTRSYVYDQYKDKINSLTIGDLLTLLAAHPEMIRRPIMIDHNRLQIGFNDDEIRCFLPRKVRKSDLERMIRNVQ